MNKFLKNLFLFLLPLALLCLAGIFLPATPKASKSLLFAQNAKDSLLRNTSSPRIIFIGGSNLSFGLNSQLIKDKLGLNPVNTGIHANQGLLFMMRNASKFIKQGDIVVLVPEYHQFYEDYAFGGDELYRTVLDVNLDYGRNLNNKQIAGILKFLPKYSLTVINPKEYRRRKEDKYYSVNSFNAYGDAYKHWGDAKVPFESLTLSQKKIDRQVVKEMRLFRQLVEQKGGRLLVSFPGYEASSFKAGASQIKDIEITCKQNGFDLLGTPERYAIPDSLTFNTPYHLLKSGADYRTGLLIEDLKAKFPEF